MESKWIALTEKDKFDPDGIEKASACSGLRKARQLGFDSFVLIVRSDCNGQQHIISIAKDLFSVYGLSTSQEFRTQFIDSNTIGLATDNNSDPKLSTIKYRRIE